MEASLREEIHVRALQQVPWHYVMGEERRDRAHVGNRDQEPLAPIRASSSSAVRQSRNVLQYLRANHRAELTIRVGQRKVAVMKLDERRTSSRKLR